MLHTTFTLLRKAGACADGYRKLAKHLGGVNAYGADTPIPLTTVLDSNGIDDALWCLSATLEPVEGIARDIACDWAERALALVIPDPRSVAAVETARRYARGEATDGDLASAWDAAWDAAMDAAMDAAWDAARAAARTAAWDAAWDAAMDAAMDAAGAAARAAGAAAKAAEHEWQAERLRVRLLAHDADTNPLGLLGED